MQDSSPNQDNFIVKVTEIIELHLSEESFGVSELAREMGMDRSNLLRKIKKSEKISVSQFIRKVRIQHSLEMLRKGDYSVSEISYKVGFSSTSYFIKCFKDLYGFPPGETSKHIHKMNDPVAKRIANSNWMNMILLSVGLIIILITLYVAFGPTSKGQIELEKSIAVLPFINDSNDSTNVYIINGLMESILNNLQKIEDLRVISRTSVEKYRNTPMTIPEIAKELNVSYFVEGSGQKIGDEIMLNIQLIEAKSDKHLWAQRYQKETKDIFQLQIDIAQSITDEIEVIITPEEQARIDKPLTDNIEAYDYYMKGMEFLNMDMGEGLEDAVINFEKAIELDSEFAGAYASLAITHYYLDVMFEEKQYVSKINQLADKALLLDPQLSDGHVAKALYYMITREGEKALPYLEKALEYNPNSSFVIGLLSQYYATYLPNTKKYLEYALKGIRIDVTASDSSEASLNYLHISNAFIQSGFVEEAELYINKSLDYNPDNIYSAYVKAYILYAKGNDLDQTAELLVDVLNRDKTRLDVVQEVGKLYYYMRDYKRSYAYYKPFDDARIQYKLRIFTPEDAKIGLVYDQMGYKEKAIELFQSYLQYAENDQSIYQKLSLATYYSYMGDVEKSLDYLQQFSDEDNYQYWIILFLKIDPLIDNIKDLPEFIEIMNRIETKFWQNHNEIKLTLEEKQLL